MSPPLPAATTVRLPEDLVTWLDAKVRSGAYKSRSDAIRGLLETVSEAAPSSEDDPFPVGSIPGDPPAAAPAAAAPATGARPFEWFVVPLVAPFVAPSCAMVVFENDRLAPGVPNAFVPFGILATGPVANLRRFWVSDAKIGGGSCLMGHKRFPLEIAAETCPKTGFPSRLLFEGVWGVAPSPPYVPRYPAYPAIPSPDHLTLPILTQPNWFNIEVSGLEASAPATGRSAAQRFASSPELDHHVLLYPSTLVEVEPSDPPDNDAGTIRRRVFPSAPISRRLRDVLDEVGLVPTSPPDPAPDLPRLGLLAVRPEHRSELLERLKGQVA